MTEEQLKRRQEIKAKRLESFGKTLREGVSQGYINYLNKASRENRIIEKYL